MRAITTHHSDGDKGSSIEVHALGDPEEGGANTRYQISYQKKDKTGSLFTLPFQSGPIPEVGINGLTNEVLLAVVLDRLEGFQSGPYACTDNENARWYVAMALATLHRRTKERIARGVEGSMQV